MLFYSKPIDRCRNNISFICHDFNASDVLPIKMTHALRSFNFFIGLIEIKKKVSSKRSVFNRSSAFRLC